MYSCLVTRCPTRVLVPLVNDSAIRSALLEKNPWWRDPEWAAKDPVLAEAADSALDHRPGVLKGIEIPNLYVLTGPRRVGKSVELRRTVQAMLASGFEPRRLIYCSCDGFTAQDLRRLFAVGRQLTRTGEGPRWWLLDEITAVRGGWSAAVKDARDADLRSDGMVLTGSSTRGLREAAKDLAGRRGRADRSDRLLLPAGFRSFCRLTSVELASDLPVIAPRQLASREAREAFEELEFFTEGLVGAWEDYLRVGGFPRAIDDFATHGFVRGSFVNDLWDVIRGDVIRSDALSDGRILQLLSRIARNVASPLVASSVAEELELGNHHRVNDRIDDLVTGIQAWRCPQRGKAEPSSKAPRKVYLTDPLLARLSAAIDDQMQPPDISRISEQQLGMALLRAVERERPGAFIRGLRVQYVRTSTGAEIDFAGPDLPDLCVEGKYVDRNWKREAQTAAATFGAGLLGTRRALDMTAAIWAVPAPFIALVLDDDPYDVGL